MSRLSEPSVSSIDGATTRQSSPEVRICTPGNLIGWRTSATTAVCSWDEPYSTCSLCPDAQGYEVSGVEGPAINVIRSPCEISGLKADVDYCLEVYAKAAGDNRSEPGRLRLGVSPGTPQNLQVRMLSMTSASLIWSPPTTGEPAYDYVIACNGVPVTRVRGIDCVLNELPSDVSSVFEVRARSNAHNHSDATLASPPDPPVNLDVSATTPSSVTFTWAPVTPTGVIDYEVSINGVVVGVVTQPRYVARDLVGEYFSFAVASRDANGNVSLRSARSTPNPDREPPTRPPGLRLLCSTSTSVTLGWDASTDNHVVAGYRFFSPDGTRTDLHETCLTVRGLQAGIVYHCEVRAFDAAGNLSEASSVDVSPADKVAPSIPTNLKVITDSITSFRVGWDASQDNIGVKGYNVSLKTLKGQSVLTDTTSELSYRVMDYKKLARDTLYIFEVSAVDQANNQSAPAGIPVSTPYFATMLLPDHSLLIPGGSKVFYLRLVDGFGLPVADKEITWVSSPDLLLDTSSGKTDQSGVFMNKVTAAAGVGTHNDRYSVTATTQTPLNVLATLHFETPGLRVSDTQLPYYSTVTLYLLAADEHRNPLAGAVVEWSTSLSVRFSQTRTTTDQAGKSSVTATDTNTLLTESGTFRAMVNGIEYRSVSVRFGIPGKP